MTSIVKEIGKQASAATKAVSKSIKPVNIIKWGVIPGIVIGVVVLLILLYLRIPISGTSIARVCSGTPQVCVDKVVSNKYNILWYIFAPLVGGLIAGTITYKLGVIVKNPKFGVGIAGAHMIKDVIKK